MLRAENMVANLTTRDVARTPRGMIFIVAASLALLYLVTLTADYYWDGITFALQIEKVAATKRGAALLFHQNHLFYNAVGYIAYAIARVFNSSARALYVLQIANVLAGVAAVGVFFRVALGVTRSRSAAAISSAAFAFAAVWWKLATDANAYVPSILLILICAGSLLSARPRWFVAALAFAGAMLIHQLASLFYPAALVAIFTNPSLDKKSKLAAKFSGLAWGAAIAAYYLCARFVYDITEPLAVVKWAMSNPSGVSPSRNPLPGLALLPRGSIDMVVGHNFALYRSHGTWVETFFALAALVAAVLCLLILARSVKAAGFFKGSFTPAALAGERWPWVAPMLITWAGAYIVFLLFWEPWQVLYRAFYLPPLALAFGLILSKYHDASRARLTGAAALAVAALALSNLAFYVIPQMRAAANPRVAAARQARGVWNDKTVIYFATRNEADTAFEYFNNQTEWRRLTAAARAGLADEVRRVSAQGGQVWLNKGAAELVDDDGLGAYARGREITVESPFAPARYVEVLAQR